MKVRCSWCKTEGYLGKTIMRLFIDGKYINLCRKCEDRYHAKTKINLNRK